MAEQSRDRDGPVLAAKSLDVALAGLPVLKTVDLEVFGGEICALIGPNGAGKTTFMRAACGLVRPAAGTVSVLGKDPVRSSKARARIGLVPQEIALYDHLSVRENLFVLGRLSGLSRADLASRVPEALERAQLTGHQHTRVARLSGGYQRRTNIACALLHQPALLVLDEPTVAVDQAALDGVLALIADLRDDGMAILLSTHELDRAERLADRVAILVDGQLRAVGRPHDLVSEHYDGGHEIMLRLGTRPAPDVSVHLQRVGLSEAESGLIWRGFVDLTAGGIEAELKALEIDEIRVRKPGLDTLYAALCDRKSPP